MWTSSTVSKVTAGFFIILLHLAPTKVFMQLNEFDPENHKSETRLPEALNGMWKLESMEIDLIEPEKRRIEFRSPEWIGEWNFHDGYFSSFLMRSRRVNLDLCETREFGFESYAGTFAIQKDQIKFRNSFAFSPLDVGKTYAARYEIVRNKLRLEIRLSPTLEDMRKGTIEIDLRR